MKMSSLIWFVIIFISFGLLVSRQETVSGDVHCRVNGSKSVNPGQVLIQIIVMKFNSFKKIILSFGFTWS